jgi:predicted Zn-dependent protease
MLFVATAAAGCGWTRSAADPAAPVLSVGEEIELGRALAPPIEASLGGRLDDPVIQAYVRTVGERVARSTPSPGLPYHFSVLASASPEAVALPGGPVCIARGLLEKLGSEGELAAALARELAHINARHVGREATTKYGVPALVAAIPNAAMDTRAEAAARQAKLARIAATLRELRYDPETEGEADRLGLDYLAAAGYNPASMVALLEITARSAPAAAAPPVLAGRADAIRRMIARKYVDRGGRVGREEYAREVLDRLRIAPPVPAAKALTGGST